MKINRILLTTVVMAILFITACTPNATSETPPVSVTQLTGVVKTGILAESIGAQWSIGGFAILLIGISFMAMLFMPGLRRLD
jgi:hypothetical protein